MAKGSNYERKICKALSLWLSSDTKDVEDDDHVWRSAGSGGRATSRAKKGKLTKEHAGDISPTSNLGRKFIKTIATEIKVGYGKYPNLTLSDELDTPEGRCGHTLIDFIKQAIRSKKLSKSQHWMVIHQRDRRKPLVYCNVALFDAIKAAYSHKTFIGGRMQLTKKLEVSFFRLEQLFKQKVTPFKNYVL